MTATLPCDPYNIIITGVGGQGNVLASRLLARRRQLNHIHAARLWRARLAHEDRRRGVVVGLHPVPDS